MTVPKVTRITVEMEDGSRWDFEKIIHDGDRFAGAYPPKLTIHPLREAFLGEPGPGYESIMLEFCTPISERSAQFSVPPDPRALDLAAINALNRDLLTPAKIRGERFRANHAFPDEGTFVLERGESVAPREFPQDGLSEETLLEKAYFCGRAGGDFASFRAWLDEVRRER